MWSAMLLMFTHHSAQPEQNDRGTKQNIGTNQKSVTQPGYPIPGAAVRSHRMGTNEVQE